MSNNPFSESVVEEAALAWLASVGWSVKKGIEIAPGEPAATARWCSLGGCAMRLRGSTPNFLPKHLKKPSAG